MISTKMNLGVEQLQKLLSYIDLTISSVTQLLHIFFRSAIHSFDYVSRLVALWLRGDCHSSALTFSKDVVQ